MNFDDYLKSGYKGKVHYRNRVIGGEGLYDVDAALAESEWQYITGILKVPESQLYISAMAPTEKTLIQGEVCYMPGGLCLTYTLIKKPMRDALKEKTCVARTLIAQLILDYFLDQRSLDHLIYLLEEYPDHVVEFSTYSVEWGTVPGYNTVFWEIRKY